MVMQTSFGSVLLKQSRLEHAKRRFP